MIVYISFVIVYPNFIIFNFNSFYFLIDYYFQLGMDSARSIEYTINSCYFKITFQQTKQISIKITHFPQKKEFTTLIDHSMIRDLSINTEQLYRCIFKQFIYQNKIANRMIKISEGEIVINFDYPKCQLKPMRFKCQEISLDQTQLMIEKINKLVDEKLKIIQEAYAIHEQKIMQKIDQKMKLAFSTLQKKIGQMRGIIDEQTLIKVREFQRILLARQKQNAAKYQKTAQECLQKIIADCSKLKKEINITCTRLEEGIRTLDQNFTILSEKMQDLETQLMEQHQKTQDMIQAINGRIEEINRETDKKLEEINRETSRKFQSLIASLKKSQIQISENALNLRHFYKQKTNRIKAQQVPMTEEPIFEGYTISEGISLDIIEDFLSKNIQSLQATSVKKEKIYGQIIGPSQQCPRNLKS